MRYGEPSIADRLDALATRGADRVIVMPLYPQYSATTNASVDDAVRAANRGRGVTIAPAFHDDPLYIDALAARARASLSALGWAPQRVVISFHGLPERLIGAGDPYRRECEETARLLRAAMGWSEDFAPLAYQSRFGREKWLGPPTDETLRRFAGEGVGEVAVVTPGFVSDCIETLEEIAITAGERFLAAGGKRFAALPCLNDSLEMIALLKRLARKAIDANFP
jgi:ferrochelatase